MEVFDRPLKSRQRAWALTLEGGEYYDYLREESAAQICERLDDITREFPTALDLGSHRGHMFKALNSRPALGEGGGGVGGVKMLYELDMAVPGGAFPGGTQAGEGEGGVAMASTTAARKETAAAAAAGEERDLLTRMQLSGDEASPLSSVPRESLDLVTSSMNLHWINDLPAALVQIKQALRPDGCFIGSLLGGATLQELRHCLYLAEQERRGGVSPHVSPLVTPSDMAGLMQGAGFALPTIDIETVTVSYPDAFTLMEHLSLMGEGAAALNRQLHVGRDTFMAAAALYQQLYALEDGSVPVSASRSSGCSSLPSFPISHIPALTAPPTLLRTHNNQQPTTRL
jgi:NADH dehydrogenase [ubiquinone] 1 alpha subcomplex assembly factor 5